MHNGDRIALERKRVGRLVGKDKINQTELADRMNALDPGLKVTYIDISRVERHGCSEHFRQVAFSALAAIEAEAPSAELVEVGRKGADR